MEKLIIAGREFNSRLFLGTGKFNSNQVMEQAILASGTEMVTEFQARHILVRIDADTDDSQARGRIDAIAARIAGGADFALDRVSTWRGNADEATSSSGLESS